MKDDVEAYKKAQQDLDKYASQYAETTARLNSEMKASDVKTYEDFKKYRDEYIDQLKKVFKEEGIKKSDKEIGEMADNYLKQLGDLETFVDQYNVGEKLKKQFKDSDKDVKEFINSLKTVDRVEILPYHNMGKYKWDEYHVKYELENVRTATDEDVERAKKILEL